jgi:hypothetical protein
MMMQGQLLYPLSVPPSFSLIGHEANVGTRRAALMNKLFPLQQRGTPHPYIY